MLIFLYDIILTKEGKGMEELPSEYTKKGFYIITKIEYKNKEYIKCGNINDMQFYFFEIKNKIIKEVQEEERKELIENFCYKIDPTKVY